ncbi:hypothetical protein [Magnetofaba australis]|uniref:Lipoprotein n=1 Tax=Magnetofaba australis IT-1 TaxID=1434232 RepID=A0A1Y2K0N7_9PROT|nr:hypothetical protein [Magnetofaba australis]OSM00313.1 hypothetical protein MAIT1_00804 [Magnetofaba australis IT-1]
MNSFIFTPWRRAILALALMLGLGGCQFSQTNLPYPPSAHPDGAQLAEAKLAPFLDLMKQTVFDVYQPDLLESNELADELPRAERAVRKAFEWMAQPALAGHVRGDWRLRMTVTRWEGRRVYRQRRTDITLETEYVIEDAAGRAQLSGQTVTRGSSDTLSGLGNYGGDDGSIDGRAPDDRIADEMLNLATQAEFATRDALMQAFVEIRKELPALEEK